MDGILAPTRRLRAQTAALALSLLCSVAQSRAAENVVPSGTIENPDITESSGLIASRRYPGAFWTHNDAGSDGAVFAITRQGKSLGTFEVNGADLNDLEDIAVDNNGNLYLADIGADGANRNTIAVHRIPEPNPRSSGVVQVNRTWRLKFPGNRDDAEGFFVHNGAGYVITKPRKNGKVTLFTFALNDRSRTITLRRVTRISVTAPVTAADLSADGRRLGLVSEGGVYVIFVNGNPAAAGSASRVLTRFPNEFIEGGTFVGRGFLVSSETGELFFFNDPRFNR